MKRKFSRAIIMIAVIALSGALLLHTSQSVQQVEAVLDRLNADIAREKQGIEVLEAEWAALNSPYRLERLAVESLGMLPPNAAEMQTDFSCLPEEIAPEGLVAEDAVIKAQPVALVGDDCPKPKKEAP